MFEHATSDFEDAVLLLTVSLAQLLALPDFSVSRVSLDGVYICSEFQALMFLNSPYASCKF